jgi:hypothetical protein
MWERFCLHPAVLKRGSRDQLPMKKICSLLEAAPTIMRCLL